MNQALVKTPQWTVKSIFLVFLVCAVIIMLPAGAANATQTASPTQTTAPATTTSVATTVTSTTHTTSPVTFSTTTTVSATQTTIPATSATTSVQTTAAQSQVNPTVAFSSDETDGTAPLTVQFHDMSTGGPIAWSWDFGDGTSDSSQNPSHTYYDAGTYTVRLAATTRTGSTSATRDDYIVVEPSPTITATPAPTGTSSDSNLLAAFDGSPRSGVAPLIVVFSDTTVGAPISWLWDFGDAKTDTSQNPVHTYNNAGTYTVTLTVNSSSSGKIVRQVDFITVSAPLDSVQPELTLPGPASNDYQVKASFTPLAGPDAGPGQYSTGKTNTPTPTLTGKAWLDYEKQRMAEVDAIAATKQEKDFISQIIDLFRGLFSWI